jgi:DNA-binding beta-propeller fold protein YncE
VATAGTPIAAGVLPVAIAVDPGGSFLYVANEGEASFSPPLPAGVSAYRNDAKTGALKPVLGDPVAPNMGASSVAVSNFPPTAGVEPCRLRAPELPFADGPSQVHAVAKIRRGQI